MKKDVPIAAHIFAISAFVQAAVFPTSVTANLIAAGAAIVMAGLHLRVGLFR
jgi:hypothetical protein